MDLITSQEQPWSQDWQPTDGGATMDSEGPEGGKIVRDIENVHGARIAVEVFQSPKPHWIITYGIYGLLFHTHRKPDLAQVESHVLWLQNKISQVFHMYELDEEQRTSDWFHEHDRLVHELTID